MTETRTTAFGRPVAGRRDIERFLRVDHAGERAAQQIYRGQLAILRNHATGPQIQHMMEQEVEHLEAFEDLLNERQVRPSLLDPVWGAAGFALGAVTAAMGPKAAMACTIAVEEVIGEHYADQAERLGDEGPRFARPSRSFVTTSWSIATSLSTIVVARRCSMPR